MCSSETDSLGQMEMLAFGNLHYTEKGSYNIKVMYTNCSIYIHLLIWGRQHVYNFTQHKA